MDSFRHILNSFLSNPTWDLLLLLFFFAAVFIYGLMVGRNKIIVLLLASYPAALINQYFPYPEKFVNQFNTPQILFLKVFSFFVLVLFVFWILSKSGFSRREINKKTGQVLFLSFLNVGFWANIVFSYVPQLNTDIIKLAPLTQLLFGSNTAHFVWLILPVLALFYLERK
ncbi:MAG: hypothetical protein Q8P06_01925 [Candidatus Azambacteria bacterium]|nr:hypothetical protein [Candidatus Azambacteria bacterium]